MITLSPVLRDAAPYCWLLEWEGLTLGVHREDGWYAQFSDQWMLINAEYKCVHLLPLLELEHDEFFAFLSHAEEQFPAYAAVIRNFPRLLLLQCAFRRSCPGYWPELAMTWLERDIDLQPSLKEDVEALTVNKHIQQHLRHRARRIVRRLLTIAA